MRKPILYLLFVLLWLFSSCSQSDSFTIQGFVDGAENDTLFIEKIEMGKIELLFSQVLHSNGKFRYSSERPVEPLYLRVRLQQQSVYLVVDSTETISLVSNKKSFALSDSITGSATSVRMREVVKQVASTEHFIADLQQKNSKGEISATQFSIEVNSLLDGLKTYLRQEIYKDTRSSLAYFALYQQVVGRYLFDPYDREDVKVYAAVATPLQVNYPNTIRTKNAEDIVLKGMQRRKNAEDKMIRQVIGKGFIDISLPNAQGTAVSLSSTVGKATILDFSLYRSGSSYAHNVLLQELYRVYAAKGLRIYQVSFDDSTVFPTVAKQLPFVTVVDNKGLSSTWLTTYNIETLPSTFLLDKDGEIVARNVPVPLLEKFIKELLQ